jgi:phage terminase large subunit-like protein
MIETGRRLNDRELADLYREDIVRFAEEQFFLRRGERIQLAEHQQRILRAIFTRPYPSDVVWSAPKKSGKTTIAALVGTYVSTFLTPEDAEVYICANDLTQSQDRVYADVQRAFRLNPVLSVPKETRVDQTTIRLSNGVRIIPMAADYASAAGPRQSLAVFDELWAYQDANRRRMFHELTPILSLPFSMRWISSYAGFDGKPEEQIVAGLIRQAMKGARVFDDLPVWRNGELLVYWDHGPEAWRMPWQQGPRAESRRANERATMPPAEYERMHLNEITGSVSRMVSADQYDSCIDIGRTPLSPTKAIPITAALDVGIKSDTTGLVGVVYDLASDVVVPAWRFNWVPVPGKEVDLQDVEDTIAFLHQQYALVSVMYDPYQAKAIAQRLLGRGVPMVEFPQTTDRLTLICQSLLDLIRTRRLRVFPDDVLREHVLNAVVVETPRGARIAKEKATQKIDLCVALAMAAYGATSLTEYFINAGENEIVEISPI